MTSNEKPRQRARKTTKKDLKYTKFVYEFLETLPQGGKVQFFKNASKSINDAYYWFDKDDAPLNSIIDLFEANGYTITFRIDTQPERKEDNIAVVTVDKTNPETGEPAKPSRLRFLKDYMIYHDKTVTQIAQQLGIWKTTVYGWLQRDSIMLSYVYRIAELNGAKLYVNIKRTSSISQENTPRSKYLK